MIFTFCKKSVFSVIFLVFFLIGTICGIFLFRALYYSNAKWLIEYCRALECMYVPGMLYQLLFLLLPFLCVFAAGLTSFCRKLIPGLVAARGMVFSYFICAIITVDFDCRTVFLRNLILLPLFYVFCRYVFITVGRENR